MNRWVWGFTLLTLACCFSLLSSNPELSRSAGGAAIFFIVLAMYSWEDD